MTDYTQMTDQELADAAIEMEALQSEQYRRQVLKGAPTTIRGALLMSPGYGGDKVEILLAAMNMTPRSQEPDVEWGPEGDIPTITDEEAAEVITALQARIDAV